MDWLVVATLVGSFAALVTAHVALAFGLVFERPRWRAVVALLVFPLAPYWGLQAGMRTRGLLWIGAGVVYTIALVAAS